MMTVLLETVNYCNLKCPACPWHTTMSRKKKILTPSEYSIIFSKVKNIAGTICFYMMGEPLLNPYLFQYIRTAHKVGIHTLFSSNGMLIDKYIDELFESGLDYIQIALDGFDKETHETYRVGSSFEHVKSNLFLLVAEKEKRFSDIEIGIQTIVSCVNEGQLETLAEFSRELGLSFNAKKMTYGKTEDIIRVNKSKFEPQDLRYRRDASDIRYYSQLEKCPQLNENLVILCNGDVVPCCYDYDGSIVFGNLLRDSVEEVLEGVERNRFLHSRKYGKAELCQRCDMVV